MGKRENYISFVTIFRKEVIRFVRIWPQTLMPSAVLMALYFIIFGTFIGSQIPDMQGFAYMQFLVPGLIMMPVITNSYSNVVSSFFGSKFQKSVEELIVSPTSSYIIVLGYSMSGVVRGLIIAGIVTIVSMAFVPLEIFNLWIILIFVVLTSFLFSLAGLINGIFARKFDDISIIPNFVLTPLTYLGGVFYSITLLPEVFQNISKLNPILYMINGFRYGFLGISDVDIVLSFGMVIVFTLGLFAFCVYLLDKGIGLKN